VEGKEAGGGGVDPIRIFCIQAMGRVWGGGQPWWGVREESRSGGGGSGGGGARRRGMEEPNVARNMSNSDLTRKSTLSTEREAGTEKRRRRIDLTNRKRGPNYGGGCNTPAEA